MTQISVANQFEKRRRERKSSDMQLWLSFTAILHCKKAWKKYVGLIATELNLIHANFQWYKLSFTVRKDKKHARNQWSICDHQCFHVSRGKIIILFSEELRPSSFIWNQIWNSIVSFVPNTSLFLGSVGRWKTLGKVLYYNA